MGNLCTQPEQVNIFGLQAEFETLEKLEADEVDIYRNLLFVKTAKFGNFTLSNDITYKLYYADVSKAGKCGILFTPEGLVGIRRDPDAADNDRDGAAVTVGEKALEKVQVYARLLNAIHGVKKYNANSAVYGPAQ